MSDNSNFSFKYIESGGLTARYLLVSFDSNTNALRYSTDASGAIASDKPVTDSNLKEVIVLT
jgi:hypothetical protein